MAKNKWLYQFTVNKETKEVVKEESVDDEGQKITIEKEVLSKKPVSFFIKKPNRKMYDDAELFYSVKLSEGIKAGLLTRPLLERRYENDGGIFADSDKDRYADIYRMIFEKENDLQRIALNLEKKESAAKKEELAQCYTDLSFLRRELQDFEMIG